MRIFGLKLFYIAAMAMSGLALPQAPAQANSFPQRSIKIIVPFPAGGWVDSTARIIGEKLAEKYRQPVLVENRTGAGGSIGADLAAKSAPDGYTVLCVSPSHAILPSILKNIGWDPNRDFRAVQGIGEIATVIAVPYDLPVKNMGELMALAKKSGDSPLSIGSGGVGTSIHLAGVLLAQQAGINLTHVPYRGQPDAMADLLAARITMMPIAASIAIPYIKSKKLRGLAVTGAARSALLPDVPTVAETANLPAYQASTWTGLVVPKEVPDAIVEQLSADIGEILHMPDVQTKLQALGMDVKPQDAQQFDTFIAAETRKWEEVIKRGNLALQ